MILKKYKLLKKYKNGLQKLMKLGKHLFFLLDEITQKSPNNNKSYLREKIRKISLQKNTILQNNTKYTYSHFSFDS